MALPGESWPVRIGAFGAVGVSPGAVVWRVEGASEARVTVVVKATFTLVPEGTMEPREPDPLAVVEVHHHADSQCSLRVASDLAPYRARAEVVLTGHAYAPPGAPTTAGGARLVVHRDQKVLVSKTVSIQGDRKAQGGELMPPTPFQRMPLLYERAAFDPARNPVGADAEKGHAPNLMHAAHPALPGCFAPIARQWPVRRDLLGGIDWRMLEMPKFEFPEAFAWDYFHTAPEDQRLEMLRGDEGILLGGMHPSRPMVRTRLPGVRAAACVYASRDASEGERMPLWGDTLLIDTDRQVASLVWRGSIAVDKAAVRALRIRAGVAVGGEGLAFPGERPPQREPDLPHDDEDAATLQIGSRFAPHDGDG